MMRLPPIAAVAVRSMEFDQRHYSVDDVQLSASRHEHCAKSQMACAECNLLRVA